MRFPRAEVRFLLMSRFCPRGKQQIHEQIQKRLEDKSMQEEMEKLERKQEVEKQEKAHLEELKVPPSDGKNKAPNTNLRFN